MDEHDSIGDGLGTAAFWICILLIVVACLYFNTQRMQLKACEELPQKYRTECIAKVN